jgi:hypothetical protein
VTLDWYECQTGGGCTALRADAGNRYALITDDAAVPASPDIPCTMGIYHMDGDPINWQEYPNLNAAKSAALHVLKDNP